MIFIQCDECGRQQEYPKGRELNPAEEMFVGWQLYSPYFAEQSDTRDLCPECKNKIPETWNVTIGVAGYPDQYLSGRYERRGDQVYCIYVDDERGQFVTHESTAGRALNNMLPILRAMYADVPAEVSAR